MKQLFETYGHTWQSTSFGRADFNSIEPENIQSVLAVDFDSWGVEPMRYPGAGPFMGKGIFTSDGPFWQHARAQVKPIFNKAQYADLETFEVHLKRFFDLVPKDGSTVDVLPLLGLLMRTWNPLFHLFTIPWP